jgi:hypothetical protein
MIGQVMQSAGWRELEMIDDNLAFVRDMEEDLFNRRDLTAVDRYVSPAYTLRTAEEGAFRTGGDQGLYRRVPEWIPGPPHLD